MMKKSKEEKEASKKQSALKASVLRSMLARAFMPLSENFKVYLENKFQMD
jgi:hypothetical protein